MSAQMEDLFREAHNLRKTARDLTEVNSLAYQLLVEELDSWIFQWIHRVYEALFSHNELPPPTLNDQEVFKGVNLVALKTEPAGEVNGNADYQSQTLEIGFQDVRSSCENSYRVSNFPTPQHKKPPSGRPTKFPQMEKELCKWISFSHSIGQEKNLTQYKIIQKAKEIQKLLYPDQQFTGSKGWFERFGNRNPQYLRLTLKHGRPRYFEKNKEQRIKKNHIKDYKIGKGESSAQGRREQEKQNRSFLYITEEIKEEISQIFIMDDESLSSVRKQETKNHYNRELTRMELP